MTAKASDAESYDQNIIGACIRYRKGPSTGYKLVDFEKKIGNICQNCACLIIAPCKLDRTPIFWSAKDCKVNKANNRRKLRKKRPRMPRPLMPLVFQSFSGEIWNWKGFSDQKYVFKVTPL